MNPLILKGIRERLRLKQLIAASLFCLIITASFYLSSYLQGAQDKQVYDHKNKTYIKVEGRDINGARNAFGTLLVVQGFFLMFLGTGRVASITAEDKESGLLDYQRMTPMNPLSKIAGYIFGIPAREYYMFLLTLPFMVHCVSVGEIPWFNVLHLYLVFFSSVILYHLTAHVTGLVVPKPRAASWMSRIVVMGLYLVLPALGQAGISVFSFLTTLPTYFGKIVPHLAPVGMPDTGQKYSARGHWSEMKMKVTEFWQDVPFYHLQLSPAVFTFIMQALLLAALLVTAYRKWRNASLPAFSKRAGLIIFCVLQFLLLGSLWSFFAEGNASGLLGQSLSADAFQNSDRLMSLIIVQSIFVCLSIAVIFGLVNICCPDRHLYMKGLQRAERQNLARLPWMSDERSGIWLVIALAVITSGVQALLAHLAASSEAWSAPASMASSVVVPFLLILCTCLYLQAARELWFSLGFFGFVALLWVTPILTSMVLAAGWADQMYGAIFKLLAFCPLSVTSMHLVSVYAESLGLPETSEQNLQQAKWLGVLISLALAVLLQVMLRRQRESGGGEREE
ncbi:MAG: hypothetical protein ACPH2J_08055 [Akkermansiaceae bacterium]